MLVNLQRLNENADAWSTEQYEAELKILCAISHRNICRLYAFSADGPNRCLVMELCTGGALGILVVLLVKKCRH